MISFSVWFNWKSDRWDILKNFSGWITKNWAWEFNIYATHSWVMLDTRLLTKGDHRGFFLMVGVLGYALDINIYDTRHDEKSNL
jgi:hypothetical protein